MSGENSERTGRAQIEMAEENFERMGKSKIEIEIAGEENSERMRRTEIARKENEDNLSTDQIFESKEVLSWRNQLTVRAFVVSAVLTFFFSFIVMKLSLTTGFIPPLNTAAGVLGFFFTKTWTTVLEKTGLLHQPFTRQENTIIQACVGAATGIAYSGGFGGYMLGMSEIIASRAGIGNTPINIKNPSLGWMIGFFFVVSFVGIFLVVPLGKILIINHKLIYPSGTATAHLINSFHAPQGAKQVKKQASTIFKTFGFSFFWAFFQWFFTAGENCGFVAFPTFGLKAYEHKFYFDFSATYVGVGMLCPYIINISLLLGAVLSWGIMWPLIEAKKGDWFSAKLSPNSLQGLQGYKVFISIAVILGDGLLHFSIVFYKTIRVFFRKMMRKDKTIPVVGTLSPDNASSVSYDEQRRTELFLKDQIPYMYAFIGYIVLAIVSIMTVPYIFPQLKWYHVLVTYIIAPIMAFCNSYGSGLTDWSLAGIYGNLAIFIFAAWIGMNSGGVLAGLATGGVMMSIVSTATYLMEDLKAGYLTLTSPRSMLISQVIGTAMGCIIAPCVFWFFYHAFPLGVEGSSYPAPYATVHRGIALLGVEGISSLPKNCLTLCLAFFIGAFLLSGAREVAEHYELRVSNYMPSIMAMAIPLYLGSYFVIDMCLGSLIFFIWERTNKKNANAFKSSVASGMICGDSIWSLPASLLAVAKVDPPICMKFLSRSTNAKVDGFLTG